MPKEKQTHKKKNRWLRRILRLVLALVIFLVLIVVGLIVAIQTPFVQSKVANYAIEQLNQEFNTKVRLDSVDIDFFGDVNLYGIKAEDKENMQFIAIQRAKLSVDLWELFKNQEQIVLDNLVLYQPDVKVITRKGDENSNFIELIDAFDDGKKSKDSKFKLEGNLQIVEGKLLIQNQNLPPKEQVWLDASNFNATIKDFKYHKKEIFATLEAMSFNAIKNGESYEVQEFSNQFFYSNQRISFDDLTLQTKDSKLIGSLSFEYDSIAQFSDFSNLVQWNLVLEKGSKIAYKDIRYWTSGWEKNKSATISGKVSGVLNNLNISNLELTADNNLILAQALNLKNPTNLDQLEINAQNLQINTSYQELNNFLPQEIAKNLDNYLQTFGKINYDGDLAYNSNKITAKGTVKTQLGNAKVNAEILNYNNLDKIAYQGEIETKQFDLKTLTQQEELGQIAGKIKFSGQGTEIENLNIDSKGRLDYLDLFGQRFKNIELDGTLAYEVFTGLAKISDPNLQASYQGVVDFSSNPIFLKFDSDVASVNLDYFGFTKNNSRLTTTAKGEIYFTDLDDFYGNLNLQQSQLQNNNTNIVLKEINVLALKEEESRTIAIQIPAYLDAKIQGKFKLQELPDAILNSFQDLIVDYELVAVSPNQEFEFEINMQKDIISPFYPELNIQPNSSLKGKINTNTDDVLAELNTPGFNYAGLDFFGTNLTINTRKEENPLQINSDSLSVAGVNFKNVQISAQPQGDQLSISTKFYSGKESGIEYNLNLLQSVDPDKNMILHFSSSNIIINNSIWLLNPSDEMNANQFVLNFKTNQYQLDEIVLSNQNQQVSLKGYYNNANDYDLSARLKDLVLSKIIPREILGEFKIDGIANGNINVIKTEDRLEPTAKIDVYDIFFDEYRIGDLSLIGEYQVAQEQLNLTAELNQGSIQALFVTGKINTAPEVPELDLEASIDELNIDFLQTFLKDALSNIRGKTSGNLTFQGPINSPSYNGELITHDFGFTVDYLKTDYLFEGENALTIFKEGNSQGVIYLEDIPFLDTQFKTKGSVSGGLLFTELSNWYFNLSFNTNNLLVLNTTAKDNDLYYGRIFANGSFHLDGFPSDLLMESQAKVNPNSQLTINTGSYFVDTNNDLVRFVPEQRLLEEIESSQPAGIELKLEVEIDELSVVNLVFDAATNDRLVSRGVSEKLEINMNKKGDLTMNGLYQITNGVYEFRQFPALQRDFSLKKGGQIIWAGSPYDANLNITAYYPRLVSNVGEYLGVGYSQVYEVNLLINMTETLSKPGFDLDLTIPKSSADVQSQLAIRMNSSPDEELKQFGFVLLTGQFGVNETNALQSGVNTAATGLAFRQISNVLSSIAREVKIDLDYVQGNDLSATSDRIGARVSLDLHPRIVIRGTGGVPLDNAYNENLTLEVEAEYDVSKEGNKSLLITGFSRPTTFGVENFNATTATQQYGIGISYNKSFNRFRDLFKSKKRIEREEKELEDLKKRLKQQRDSIEQDSIRNMNLPIQEKTLDSAVVRNKLRMQPAMQNTKKVKSPQTPLVRFK